MYIHKLCIIHTVCVIEILVSLADANDSDDKESVAQMYIYLFKCIRFAAAWKTMEFMEFSVFNCF